MTWENAADYLSSKMDQTSFLDASNGRAEGMKQFLDDKSFKPGLGTYKKS
jgi:trans-feruloyl-CoA hydratase/vanillin synthase